MALLLVFSWHEIGFVWVSFGEPAGKFSRSFVRRGGGAPCIMVLAREVWNCVHKLNYFNLREREWESERIMESGCASVCCIYMWNVCMCVDGERERQTHFYSSTGLTFTRGNINQVAGDYRGGQVLPCSWKLQRPPLPQQQLPVWKLLFQYDISSYSYKEINCTK